MKNKTMILRIVLLCGTLIFIPRAAVADDGNLLRDPGFELRLPPDQGGWILFDESMYSSDRARGGRQSIFNWGFSRSVPSPPFLAGTVSGSYQEFAAAPGSRWRMTGYGLTSAPLRGTPAFGIVQVSFFDARGNDLGTVETAGGKTPLARISNKVNSQTPADEWVFLDTGVATAPAGAATVQAFTLYVDYSASNRSQGVFFDDLHLCALANDGGDKPDCIAPDS